MTTQTTNLPIKVEEFTNIIQSAPDILSKNQTSVKRCNDAGKTLLDTIEGNGGINSDELDKQTAEFIDRTKTTVKNMNDRRSPLTQLLTKVAKEFTTLENEIISTNANSYSAKLQAYRNKYAAKKLEEVRKQEEAAKRLKAIEDEKSEYRTDLALSLEKHYSRYFDDFSSQLLRLFNEITLANFYENSKQIDNFSTVYPVREHFSKFLDTFRAVYLDENIKHSVKQEVVPGLMDSCVKRFGEDIQNLKDDLILKLPSRKRELENIEELRKQNAEAAETAEKAAKAREAEEARKREEEKKQREAEERAKLEAQTTQSDIFSSFAQTADAVQTNIPEAKISKKIKVNNAKGFLEIYQMWFLGEGAKLPIEELEKIHKKMLTFCEKKANKESEFITSAFVEYVDDVKAK